MSEGFLNRWSRVKQAGAESASEADLLPDKDESVPETEGSTEVLPADPSMAEAEPLTDEDMPDIESIDSRSDMSAFFSTGVSSELKRQALRKYFHQPEFNFRDPLDEYNLDYSQPKKLAAVVGAKVRNWAEQQLQDAMQQARDNLVKVDEDNAQVGVKDQVDTTEPDRPEKTIHEETK